MVELRGYEASFGRMLKDEEITQEMRIFAGHGMANRALIFART
jgi:hypothetical protein